GQAGEGLSPFVEGEHGEDRQRGDATDGFDRRFELFEVEEGLDGEEVDAAALERCGLLGEDLCSFLWWHATRLAEGADGAGDEDVAAGNLARLAGELDAAGVDLVQLVFEVVRGELAPVRAERVRLDQVGAALDGRGEPSKPRGGSPNLPTRVGRNSTRHPG